MRIFLGYRRDDASGHAGRLHDALSERFGDKQVFQDVDTIEAGEDFVSATNRALESSDAALIVIGPGWLEAEAEDGTRRLDDPDDLVRLEVVAALAKSPRVVPVLVGGARLPTAEQLPGEIRSLVERQAFELRDTRWAQDFDQLAESLSPPSRRPAWVIPAVIGAVAAVIVVVGWQAAQNAGDDSGPPPPPECAAKGEAQFDTLALRSPDPSGEFMITEGSMIITVTDAESRPVGDGRWEVVLDTSMMNETNDAQEHAYYHYERLNVDGVSTGKPTCSNAAEPIAQQDRALGRVGFTSAIDPADNPLMLVMKGEARIPLTP